jgi:hypothetical protein
MSRRIDRLDHEGSAVLRATHIRGSANWWQKVVSQTDSGLRFMPA